MLKIVNLKLAVIAVFWLVTFSANGLFATSDDYLKAKVILENVKFYDRGLSVIDAKEKIKNLNLTSADKSLLTDEFKKKFQRSSTMPIFLNAFVGAFFLVGFGDVFQGNVIGWNIGWIGSVISWALIFSGASNGNLAVSIIGWTLLGVNYIFGLIRPWNFSQTQLRYILVNAIPQSNEYLSADTTALNLSNPFGLNERRTYSDIIQFGF